MTRSLTRRLAAAAVAVAAAWGADGAGVANAAGLLTPSDGTLPSLDIREHTVAVVVEDGYALTTVEQVFHNPHSRDLEAVYSFPVPEKAAVSRFTYWIDGKPVNGEVLAREKARTVYEDEKAAGREAAITEQDEYKTFDISVWPVRAGGDVRIRLGYIQPAHLDTGIGRYAYPLEEGGVDVAKLAFWTANEVVKGRFSFDLTIRTAYPVEAVRLPSHPGAVIDRDAHGHWHVHLDSGAAAASENGKQEGDSPAAGAGAATTPKFRLDQDIVVYWRQKSGLPAGVELIPYRAAGADRGTFMLTVTPGDDLRPITGGRDWTFVLDKSGSMQAKFATMVEGVSRGLHALRPDDRFRIILFDDAATDLTGGYRPASESAIAEALRALGAVHPDKGTALYSGLRLGLDGIDADRVSAVLLVTDGVANVGTTDRKSFLNLVRRADVRLFTFVMGNSANRPLLDAIARESNGAAFSVSNTDDIVGAVLSATSKVGHEALHDVAVAINGVRTADLSPARLGSIYRGQQLVVFGHYWGDGEADLTFTAKVSGASKSWKVRVPFREIATANPEIECLWAYAAIEGLMHERELLGGDADIEDAITDIGTGFGLVTPFTSMVVVRDDVFTSMGIDRTNRDRMAAEDAARATRLAAAPVSHRVASGAPVSGTVRASYSGGKRGSGAVDPLSLGLVVLLGRAGAAALRRRATR